MEKEMKLMEIKPSSLRFKITIPKSVEKKIRTLCREINNTEWSGILFYEVEGTFEEKNLNIVCLDIYQMDEGNGVHTEFKMSPDVIGYKVDHPELMDEGVYQGLIHSHNNMATFFSGEDMRTLQLEGNDVNHFVSLIVNNAGTYTAAITRKVTSDRAVVEKLSYPTWGDSTITGSNKYSETVSYIEWSYLDVNVEKVSEDSELLARIKEIRENKFKYAQRVPVNDSVTRVGPANIIKDPEFNFKETQFEIPNDIVDCIIKQTITGSIIISNNSKLDVEKWARSMNSLYSERFGTIDDFEAFAINFADYIINSSSVDSEEAALLASKIVSKLNALPKNIWLDKWIEIYSEYIM